LENNGKLFVVTTPIGNYADMTIRGIRMIEESAIVVCEEFKEASRLLRFFGMKKDLLSINEHNEVLGTSDVIEELLNGKVITLISDCGTPGFSDPGNKLLNECFDRKIEVEFCGGANSVMASIVLSGFDISRFYFAGFVSPKKDIRKMELQKLTSMEWPIVIMEAPYRLNALLEDVAAVFKERNVFVGFDLTMQNEEQFKGTADEILTQIGDNKLKGEFVIIIDKQ